MSKTIGNIFLSDAQETEQRDRAFRMQLKAEHYAAAFQHAARILRTQQVDERVAKIFDRKSELETALAERLKDDPLGTLWAEGLL